jgi:hypothetical protein
MSSISRKASPIKKKGNGNGTAKAGRFDTKTSPARRNSKSKPMTTEEVTLRAFRRTYNRLHPRKA